MGTLPVLLSRRKRTAWEAILLLFNRLLDSSAGGFDNVDETLHISSFLMDRHLEATDKALNVAIATG